MVYLVTYDLNKPGQNYDKLYEAIKELGAWWHYLRSVWLVDTNWSSNDIRNKLRPYIVDDTDYLLVIHVQRDYSGWLPKDAWEWLNQHL